MTPESVMMMGTEAMKVALALAAPLLLVALVTGLTQHKLTQRLRPFFQRLLH